MTIIVKEDKVIYRADEGKKLLYKGSLFSEIVLRHETNEIKEVEDK